MDPNRYCVLFREGTGAGMKSPAIGGQDCPNRICPEEQQSFKENKGAGGKDTLQTHRQSEGTTHPLPSNRHVETHSAVPQPYDSAAVFKTGTLK